MSWLPGGRRAAGTLAASMRRADVLWLTGQGVLFVLAFIIVPRTDGWFGRFDLLGTDPVGWAIFGLGVVVGVVAVLQLGRQAVPQPSPVRDGTLIDTGLYAVVRHPIYTAVLLLIGGSVIRVLSVAGLLVIAVSAVFFDRKSAYEETLLAATYPGYADYRERVRWKLLPGVR
ncbi:MAG TPA: methyltransferase [Euzebyales bacterium]|nr:methyltransferase [Euzebyales bacterium]